MPAAFDFPSSPTTGQTYTANNVVYKWSGTAWLFGGNAPLLPGGIAMQDAPPTSPVPNSLWWESDSGALFARFQDVDSTAWVQINTQPPALLYDLAFSWENLTPNAETMARFVTPRAFSVATNAPGSYAKAAVAATASTTYTLKKNGSSIGTIVFAASGTTGTFTVTATAFAAGDVLTIDGPATADTTLADVALTLVTT